MYFIEPKLVSYMLEKELISIEIEAKVRI